MSGFLIALVGLVSAILGGVIQAYATGVYERSKFERQAKWDLHTRYFVVLGELSFKRPETLEHVAALAEMAQIRGRIGILGSVDVVRTVGDVFAYPDLLSSEAQEAMAAVISAMRNDLGKDSSDLESSFIQLMFGSRDR